jgi:NADH-quinone oxidoreductase subunit I
MGSMKEIFNSLLLKELLKGMSVTGKYFLPARSLFSIPRKRRRRVIVFVVCMLCAAIPMERSVVLPANYVRLSVLRWPLQSKPNRVMTVRAVPPVTTLILQSAYSVAFCEEACPVDAVVETRIFEYHGEKRGDLYYTKQMLLANGDRYEEQIALDRELDAPYR